MRAVAGLFDFCHQRGIDQPIGQRARLQGAADKSCHLRADWDGLPRISVQPRQLAVGLKPGELVMPIQ
jgi:hypothetical protein